MLALLACAVLAGAGAGAAAAARHPHPERARPAKLWRAFPLGQKLLTSGPGSIGAPPATGAGPSATTQTPPPATHATPPAGHAAGSGLDTTTLLATAVGAALLALLVAATLRLRRRGRGEAPVGEAAAPQPPAAAPQTAALAEPAPVRTLWPAPEPDDVVRAPPVASDRGSDRGAPARRARRPAGAPEAAARRAPRSPFDLITPKEGVVKYYTISIVSYSSNGEGGEVCEFAEAQEVLDAIRGDAVTSWDVVVDPKTGRAQPLVGVKESPYYVQISKQGRRRCIAKLSANYTTAHAIADTFFNQWEADAVSIVRQDQLEDAERGRCERELSDGPVELEHWSADGDGAPAIVSAPAVPQRAS